jgi:hypothetical protein
MSSMQIDLNEQKNKARQFGWCASLSVPQGPIGPIGRPDADEIADKSCYRLVGSQVSLWADRSHIDCSMADSLLDS